MKDFLKTLVVSLMIVLLVSVGLLVVYKKVSASELIRSAVYILDGNVYSSNVDCPTALSTAVARDYTASASAWKSGLDGTNYTYHRLFFPIHFNDINENINIVKATLVVFMTSTHATSKFTLFESTQPQWTLLTTGSFSNVSTSTPLSVAIEPPSTLGETRFDLLDPNTIKNWAGYKTLVLLEDRDFLQTCSSDLGRGSVYFANDYTNKAPYFEVEYTIVGETCPATDEIIYINDISKITGISKTYDASGTLINYSTEESQSMFALFYFWKTALFLIAFVIIICLMIFKLK